MQRYSVRYKQEHFNGEPGWSYDLIIGGRVVAQGWSAGRKKYAIGDVREAIKSREALLACVAAREAA